MDGYPTSLRTIARRAVARLDRRLRAAAPTVGAHAARWMRSLAGDERAERYFTHPRAFPMLLLPWWLEETIRGDPATDFQSDVVYSTISGYYAIRMVDDLMDRDGRVDAPALPSVILFHGEFERVYHRHFAIDDPFWEDMANAAYDAAEMASRDALLDVVTREAFLGTSARKVAGARVPIAAVARRYGRPELLGPWSGFVDAFGRWHQMLNDVLGWRRDLEAGRASYFLSEARRHAPGAPASWVLGDGLEWAYAQLGPWMDQLIESAADLDSAALRAYLEGRRTATTLEWDELRAAVASLRRVAGA